MKLKFLLQPCTKRLNSYFLRKEALNLHFLEQKYFLFYRRIHSSFANLKDFKVSDQLEFDKKDLDNDAYFFIFTRL
jgi:hypothetical protein